MKTWISAQASMPKHAAELAARTFAADSTSAELLFDFLRPVVARRARRALKASGADAELEDLVQDTFVWLLSNEGRVLRRWTPDKGMSLRNFVGMICERRMRGKLRASARASHRLAERDPDRVFESPTQESRVLAQDTLRALVGKLETTLSPRGMQLFRLIYIHEESVEAVCEALAMSSEAVYAWKRRLKRRLNSQMRKRRQRDLPSDSRSRPPIPRRV